jgi:hypothetical protein
MEKAHTEIEKEISIEKLQYVNLSVPQITFFLNQLKKGDVNDIKYRKTLVNIFVNTIYLFDDKITMVFNAGDSPVTVDNILFDEIEKAACESSVCMLNKTDHHTNIRQTPREYFYLGGFAFTVWL